MHQILVLVVGSLLALRSSRLQNGAQEILLQLVQVPEQINLTNLLLEYYGHHKKSHQKVCHCLLVTDGPDNIVDVFLSSSHLLTAGILEGSHVQILPLARGKLASGLPALDSIQRAHSVQLREIAETLSAPTKSASDKGKHKDWLSLLLRETLGEL